MNSCYWVWWSVESFIFHWYKNIRINNKFLMVRFMLLNLSHGIWLSPLWRYLLNPDETVPSEFIIFRRKYKKIPLSKQFYLFKAWSIRQKICMVGILLFIYIYQYLSPASNIIYPKESIKRELNLLNPCYDIILFSYII